jgi:hypothetical protein
MDIIIGLKIKKSTCKNIKNTLLRWLNLRLMKEMGLRSVLKRKFVITIDSNHQYLIAEK